MNNKVIFNKLGQWDLVKGDIAILNPVKHLESELLRHPGINWANIVDNKDGTHSINVSHDGYGKNHIERVLAPHTIHSSQDLPGKDEDDNRMSLHITVSKGGVVRPATQGAQEHNPNAKLQSIK